MQTFKPMIPTLAALLLTACAAAVPVVSGAPTPSTGLRSIEIFVTAPANIVAAGGGNLVNADPDGIALKGGLNIVAAGAGNIVAAGGGNIVAAGGGNIVAAGGGNYQVLAANATYHPVEKAVVYFTKFSAKGELLSKTAATTDPQGHVTFAAVADQNVTAVAEFKIGEKVYRMAAAVAPGQQMSSTYVDPINTLVESRCRSILAENGKTDPTLTLTDLKAVWEVFNDATVEIDLAALESGKTLADLDAFYTKALEQITDPAKKKIVTDYMAKIRAGS